MITESPAALGLGNLGKALVLDGGFGQLIADEHPDLDMSDGLWASGLAVRRPDVISQVHTRYLEAGADIITTATYQASPEGYVRAGLASSDNDAERLIADTLCLAVGARDEYTDASNKRPLIAASLGSIGATLHNFSEYTGRYGDGITVDDIKLFHLRRFQALARCLNTRKLRGQIDLVAVETVPSIAEARAIVRALDAVNEQCCSSGKHTLPPAWVSFSGSQPGCIGSGEPIEDAVEAVCKSPSVFAVGVNCVPLHAVAGLLAGIKRTTSKPIVCYPNAQTWTGAAEDWCDERARVTPGGFAENAQAWVGAGAKIVGGCCKTTPDHIRAVRKTMGAPAQDVWHFLHISSAD
ncbi:hypothetical protein GGI12_001752 [Dipsacomyces acuminosporus]|nr:hypothetical protein GGI12_001752 [Dipsacomyces acuminosporus]